LEHISSIFQAFLEHLKHAWIIFQAYFKHFCPIIKAFWGGLHETGYYRSILSVFQRI
jgi:hypothetical protein